MKLNYVGILRWWGALAEGSKALLCEKVNDNKESLEVGFPGPGLAVQMNKKPIISSNLRRSEDYMPRCKCGSSLVVRMDPSRLGKDFWCLIPATQCMAREVLNLLTTLRQETSSCSDKVSSEDYTRL